MLRLISRNFFVEAGVNNMRQIRYCGLMISGLVLERSEGEVDERRSNLQTMNDLFSAPDPVVYLKRLPPPIIIAEDLICRQIKLKYFARLALRPG